MATSGAWRCIGHLAILSLLLHRWFTSNMMYTFKMDWLALMLWRKNFCEKEKCVTRIDEEKGDLKRPDGGKVLGDRTGSYGEG